MEPLVSVIIPVYNVLPYLREALDSVINQIYKNLEILIVDDGSTDGSGEVCDEYLSDPRVIVIHQENKGLSGARNTALDRMTGEYVAFLDSDDAFMPEMIDRMVKAIIRNNADMAVCEFAIYSTDLNINTPGIQKTDYLCFDHETLLSSAATLNKAAAGIINWAVWNKIYAHHILSSIRFPEGDNYEDMRVVCKVIEQCKSVIIVPEVCIQYRQRVGSITKTPTEKNLRDHILAYNSVEKFISERISSIFSETVMHNLREQYARMLGIGYAQLLFCPHSRDAMVLLRKDILFHWKTLDGTICKFRSRSVRFLFKYTPRLIPPFRACWQAGKHFLGKPLHS